MSIAAQLEAHLRDRCARNLPAITERMVDDARQACSRRSGALAESIGADPWQDQGSRFTSTIRATAPYALFQDEGTGIYGPRGAPIVAPGGPGFPMKFFWDAAGAWRSLYTSRGSPGTHFFSGPDGREMERRFENAFAAVWGP